MMPDGLFFGHSQGGQAVTFGGGFDMLRLGLGAALGFDRLVMLAGDADTIDAIRCFNSRTA